jgi:hypothetical protein
MSRFLEAGVVMLAALAPLLAACVSLDGLSGGLPSDAGASVAVPDAALASDTEGRPVPDARSTDGFEASVADAPLVAPDAPHAPNDGGASTPCSMLLTQTSPPVLCVDFNDGTVTTDGSNIASDFQSVLMNDSADTVRVAPATTSSAPYEPYEATLHIASTTANYDFAYFAEKYPSTEADGADVSFWVLPGIAWAVTAELRRPGRGRGLRSGSRSPS